MFFFPLYPVYLFDILTSALVIFFAMAGLRLSVRLFRAEPDNLFWLYLIWLMASLSVFAVSRGFEHMLKYALAYSGQGRFWGIIEPYSGSLDTLSFVFVGGVSLFFIMVNNLYQKVAADRKKLSELNAELSRLNEELESVASERSLNLMALRVADRVRNPATIIGAIVLRLFHTQDLSEPVRKKLMDVREASGRLDLIVKEYEDILKSKEKFFKVEDLNEIARETLLTFDSRIKEKKAALALELSDVPLYFYAVKHLMRIALVHMIRNALDASPKGGRIVIRSGFSDKRIFLSIGDQGPGIDRSDIEKIFNLFYSTKGRMGTGLPMVKQIVDEHGGEIDVESSGEGSVFTLYFPAGWIEFAGSLPFNKGRGPGEPSAEGLE